MKTSLNFTNSNHFPFWYFNIRILLFVKLTRIFTRNISEDGLQVLMEPHLETAPKQHSEEH